MGFELLVTSEARAVHNTQYLIAVAGSWVGGSAYSGLQIRPDRCYCATVIARSLQLLRQAVVVVVAVVWWWWCKCLCFCIPPLCVNTVVGREGAATWVVILWVQLQRLRIGCNQLYNN